MIPKYTPEYINKIKENNSILARALSEEKKRYVLLYKEKEMLDKRVLQLTKKSHDQKKYVDYLLDVLRQTLHYLKDQSTKVEKMINKKSDEFYFSRSSLFLTPNLLDNSNFNIPSPTPTRKSYEYDFDTEFLNRKRKSNILKKSIRPLNEIDKDTSLINTSIGEDKTMSTSTSSYNASSFEGIADFVDEEIDCLRDQAKRESFYSNREASSPAELLANYNKTIIAIQDMELTYAHNTNQRILAVEDMSLASIQSSSSGRLSDKSIESKNNGAITNETPLRRISHITPEKFNSNIMESNKRNECINNGPIKETHMKKITHITADKYNANVLQSNKSDKYNNNNPTITKERHTIEERSNANVLQSNKIVEYNNNDAITKERHTTAERSDARVMGSNKSKEISTRGAIAKETFVKKLTHTIKEKFETNAMRFDKNESNNGGELQEFNKSMERNTDGAITDWLRSNSIEMKNVTTEEKLETSVLELNKNNDNNNERATKQETHIMKNINEEKSDARFSDISTNICVEKNYKCLSKTSSLSKTSTFEEPTTSESVTEITQINIMALIPNILIDRLNELSDENKNNATKQMPDEENDNKTGKSNKTSDEVLNSIKKEKTNKIEEQPSTSKQVQKLSKKVDKQNTNKKESNKNKISTRSTKSQDVNKKHETSIINSRKKLSFKIPKRSSRPRREASLNINYVEANIKEKMRRE